jgi:hypothetical protein
MKLLAAGRGGGHNADARAAQSRWPGYRIQGSPMSQFAYPVSGCRSNARAHSMRALSAVVAALAVLGGCAQDAWKPNPNFSAFLNKVQQNCGTARIGELTVSQLMDASSSQSSAYFLDMTSRLEFGKVSDEEYDLGISSTFNTVRNSAGIRCVLAQKPQ